MFNTYKAETMTEEQLRKAYVKAKRKANAFEDRHGIIGHNIEREKANAFRFELAKRGETP